MHFCYLSVDIKYVCNILRLVSFNISWALVYSVAYNFSCFSNTNYDKGLAYIVYVYVLLKWASGAVTMVTFVLFYVLLIFTVVV